MDADNIRRLTDEALEQLGEALAQGRSEGLERLLAAMAKFHRYSWSNVLLILAQRPDATRVAGFRTWKSLNRFVRRGERGIAIMAPMLLRPAPDGGVDPASDPEPARVLRFRVVHVFDLAQTDGEPLPELASATGDPGACASRLTDFAAAVGIAVRAARLDPGVHGLSRGGTIELAEGLGAAERFATLAHELAHELLHHAHGEARPPHHVRETEAEAVAFVVATAAGLDAGTSSSDYIRLHHGDAASLAASLHRIQTVAARLVSAILSGDGEDAAA